MKVRSRPLTVPGYGQIVNSVYTNGAVTSQSIVKPRLIGFQYTVSEGHQRSLLGKTSRDIGGTFTTQQARWVMSPGFANVKSSGYTQYEYKGPVFAQTHTNTLGAADLIPPYTAGQMNALGTTGIARALPTNPLSGMGQFLGELRDLPKVPFSDWKKKASFFRSLARNGSNEYLNIQFGWVPFISDLKDFAKVVKNHSSLAAQYARNSGRHVRRKVKVFHDKTVTTGGSIAWYGYPGIPSACVTSPGVLSKTTEVEVEVTFSGAFTYYLPSGNDFLSKMARYEALANRLYGLRLNPDLLWKLAPWSWAADWVSNVGDVVHNWSAFASDGLVMHYGYVMVTQTKTETWSGDKLRLINGGLVTAQDRRITVSKQRYRATPYGFGLDPGTFSAKQWSIIGALGLSKFPRSLVS